MKRMLIAAGIAALLVAPPQTGNAQAGCTAKYGYWNGWNTVCLQCAGNNCITCPR